MARFGAREDLALHEFCERFYPGEAPLVASIGEALELIETATGIARGRLRPTDRFSVDLAPEKGWEFDDELNELLWELDARGWEGGQLVTVDDFIRAIAACPSRVEPTVAKRDDG